MKAQVVAEDVTKIESSVTADATGTSTMSATISEEGTSAKVVASGTGEAEMTVQAVDQEGKIIYSSAEGWVYKDRTGAEAQLRAGYGDQASVI